MTPATATSSSVGAGGFGERAQLLTACPSPSGSLNRALPATSTLAPAAVAPATVVGPMPPSTSTCTTSLRPAAAIIAAPRRSWAPSSAMYRWPPKPGLTVITSTRSTRSSTWPPAPAGVAGLSATAARGAELADRAERAVQVPARLGVDDQPARSRPRRSGGEHVGLAHHQVRLERHGDVRPAATAITSGPKVRFGTNWPSMTSHWMRSTPASSSATTSSPSWAKSAGSTEGTISMRRCPRCNP